MTIFSLPILLDFVITCIGLDCLLIIITILYYEEMIKFSQLVRAGKSSLSLYPIKEEAGRNGDHTMQWKEYRLGGYIDLGLDATSPSHQLGRCLGIIA